MKLKMDLKKVDLQTCKNEIETALNGKNIDWKKKMLKTGLQAQIPKLKKEILGVTGKEPSDKDLIELFAYQMYTQVNMIKTGIMTNEEFLEKAKKEFKEQALV